MVLRVNSLRLLIDEKDDMAALQLSEIWHYPVKSMIGVQHSTLTVDKRGFVFDRHWMLVTPEGQFLSQRQLPKMALIAAKISGNQLELTLPESITHRVTNDGTRALNVTVWGDICAAIEPDSQASALLSEFLSTPCHLITFAPDHVRSVDPDFANSDDQVGFADAFPFLLISQASLDDLNQRLSTPVDMRRFRPNLVVTGCQAYDEDSWKLVRIGDITFRVNKPCSRCAIPGLDPDTGERTKEILSVLAQYRKRDNQIFFGQNLLQNSTGSLSVGNNVEVIERW